MIFQRFGMAWGRMLKMLEPLGVRATVVHVGGHHGGRGRERGLRGSAVGRVEAVRRMQCGAIWRHLTHWRGWQCGRFGLRIS